MFAFNLGVILLFDYPARYNLGTDHLTCKGWGYGFLFCSTFFFRTTRELEYYFFFQNLTIGYMTKTLNQIIFFPPPKSEYFFQQHWESEYFLEKKHNPSFPLEVK